MSFYIVQAGDCLSTIRHKLSKIKEFSYLKDEKYALQDKGRNINSFNVPSDLEAGMFIPIPLASEQRETGYEEFYQMSLQAVEEMKDDPNYGTAIKKILKSVNKEEMATTMCAYARSETAQDWKNFSDNIGSVTLHRREPHMESFSFSHYHILMEKNKDGSA